MSPALCFRILQHLEELGLLRKGQDTILDPMAGTGITNICAGAMGYPSVSVELEEKFVGFQKENKEYAEKRLYKPLDWTMIKGDSRRLSDLLKGQGLKSVTSPPYGHEAKGLSSEEYDKKQRIVNEERLRRGDIKGGIGRSGALGASILNPDGYGTSEGQIGNLKDVPLKSILSPPYESSLNNTAERKGWDKLANDPTSSRYGRKSIPSVGAEYSDNPDNIGNLKDTPLKSITSPPYENSQGHPSLDSVNKDDWGKEGKDIVKRRGLSGEYGDIEGQVGNLKSITSPPYEESLPNGLDRKAAEQMVQAMYDKHGRAYSKEDFEYQVELILKRSNREYGDAEGQIGKLKDKPLKSIVSPPYSEAQSGGGIAKKGYTGSKHTPTDLVGNRSYMPEVHGQSEGQIANLKDTPLKSIVSPPYGETGVGDWKTGRAEFQAWVINEIKTKGYVEWQGKRYNEAEWRAMNHGRIDGRTTKGVHKHPTDGYSDNPDNIGGLPDKPLKAITSPPYEQSITGGKSGIKWQEEWGKPSEIRQPSQDISYGESKENIGNLKDKPLNEKEKDYPRGDHNISAGYQGSENNIGKLSDKPLKSVMLPPYEGGGHHKGMLDSWGGENTPVSNKNKEEHGYGHTEGQIESAESYLEAMAKVYQEINLVSDVLCVVVKNPTRNGKLRRLDLDTIKILEMAGWKIHCQHRALLFEELEQADMFDGSKKQVKGRLSFFKRLSYIKGQPVSSWEDILVCVRK